MGKTQRCGGKMTPHRILSDMETQCAVYLWNLTVIKNEYGYVKVRKQEKITNDMEK